ncbi:unnamed protein product [Trifolium pratense]|uniref:Uncharacterized protein n=1 Tax=Trifolium pratense TaxID=57577 RepID=A0ACB0LWP8_TRIPR|nr:unnamed protein product [Trifolium pratense]
MALPTNIRVLVIDHDINLLNAIEKLCYQFNYSVKTCSNVSDAFNLLLGKKDIFDLVLIEAKMPDMDSYGFLRHVTQQINIPVIMMCADGSTSVVMKAIEDGACDYWIKPLTESLIMNMWQHVARKLWKENKNLELMSEKLPLIDQKIEEVINISVKKGSVEKNNDKLGSSTKKKRLKWSPELKRKFVSAVVELNIDKATPKKILAMMNERGMTRDHVASKLQKYRNKLKRGGETKKQRKQNKTAEATTESKISNESSEFDFEAYDVSTLHVVPMPTNFTHQQISNESSEFDFEAYDASTLHVVPMPTNFTHQQISNESSEFDFEAYDASTLHVVPNNFMPTNFTHQPNNFPHQPNAVPVKFYQTDSEEETSSSASINQQQNCNGFGTNSIINPAFINTLDAHFPNAQDQNVFLAWHHPSPDSFQ